MRSSVYQARHAIRQAESATLVEGNFDVVSLHARGIDNVVAPLGTAFTADQAKLLKRFAPNVVLLFDGDAAGTKATRLSRDPCTAAGLAAKVAKLPAGTDPDELVRQQGPAALADVLQFAQPITESFIRARLDEAAASSDPHGKVAAVNDVIRLITEEKDPLVRSELWVYADNHVASRLDIRDAQSVRALRDKFQKAAAESAPRGPTGPSAREARVSVREPGAPERGEIVGALIEHPELLEDAEVSACLSLLEGASARTVAALADSMRPLEPALQTPGQPPGQEHANERQKSLDTSSFLAQIPPPIQAFASERLAAPQHETREDAKVHLLKNAQKLRTVMLVRETSDLARETYKADGNWQEQMESAKRAQKTAEEKHGLERGGR
jgi:DNA primase